MTIPTITRPASGRRILVSANVRLASIRYLLRTRSRTVPDKYLKVEPDGQTSLPIGQLGRLANILAKDRGACLVRLYYSTSRLCTASCQDAKVETVDECVCICGGFAHGQGQGVPIPNTDSLVLVDSGTFYREVLVRRGQTFHEVLGAALGRDRTA